MGESDPLLPMALAVAAAGIACCYLVAALAALAMPGDPGAAQLLDMVR